VHCRIAVCHRVVGWPAIEVGLPAAAQGEFEGGQPAQEGNGSVGALTHGRELLGGGRRAVVALSQPILTAQVNPEQQKVSHRYIMWHLVRRLEESLDRIRMPTYRKLIEHELAPRYSEVAAPTGDRLRW
jgi:hypothetical protein